MVYDGDVPCQYTMIFTGRRGMHRRLRCSAQANSRARSVRFRSLPSDLCRWVGGHEPQTEVPNQAKFRKAMAVFSRWTWLGMSPQVGAVFVHLVRAYFGRDGTVSWLGFWISWEV